MAVLDDKGEIMKQVILKIEESNTITVDECSSLNKIYIYKSISGYYKLHNVGNGQYAFVDLASSSSWANGVGRFIDILTKTLETEKGQIFMFDSLKECVVWLYGEL
jgi:hypothetical protein